MASMIDGQRMKSDVEHAANYDETAALPATNDCIGMGEAGLTRQHCPNSVANVRDTSTFVATWFVRKTRNAIWNDASPGLFDVKSAVQYREA